MSISEIIGDFGFKGVARKGGINNWIAGIIGYIGVIYFLIKSLKVGNVTYVNGMWDGVSAILSTAAAFIIFGERLNTPSQYMGLALIIGGIFCLKGGGIPY
jgi:multidrug transporter EmrE-like cation transporter